MFTSVHASYPIYPTGPNTSPFQIPNILSAYLSQILTIPYSLSFRLDTSQTFDERHSRIIFGDLIRFIGEASDVATQGTWPAAVTVIG